jgi:prepilin-type N-terminal cleavage/methylation domain-containing protein
MHRARPGFTMLELIVVIAMIGILTAFAFPKVRAGKESADVRAAREAVASLASQARRSAIARGVPVTFGFVSSSDKKLEVRLDDNTRIAGPVDVYGGWKVNVTADDKTGAEVTGVRFDAHGLARIAANETRIFHLVSASGKRDSVCISGAGMIMRGTCR